MLSEPCLIDMINFTNATNVYMLFVEKTAQNCMLFVGVHARAH